MQTRRFPHLVRKCRPRVHVLGEGSHQQIKLVIHLLHPLLNLRVLLIDSTQSLLSSPVHLRTYFYTPTSTHLHLHLCKRTQELLSPSSAYFLQPYLLQSILQHDQLVANTP